MRNIRLDGKGQKEKNLNSKIISSNSDDLSSFTYILLAKFGWGTAIQIVTLFLPCKIYGIFFFIFWEFRIQGSIGYIQR